MTIPLYISIPLLVAGVHHDNYRRFWLYVWARCKRGYRKWTTSSPYWDRTYTYNNFRNKRECPQPPRTPRPNIFPGPMMGYGVTKLLRGSDMLLSDMKCIVTGDEVEIGNLPKDVVLIQVKGANDAKLERVRRAFGRWQEEGQ